MGNNNNVMFTYIRDAKEPARVLTIARKKDGNLITFAYCINKVTINEYSYPDIRHININTNVRETRIFDVHNKRKAREISAGRLKFRGKSYDAAILPGKSPLEAVLSTLTSNTFPNVVSRIARQALNSGFGLPKANLVEKLGEE